MYLFTNSTTLLQFLQSSCNFLHSEMCSVLIVKIHYVLITTGSQTIKVRNPLVRTVLSCRGHWFNP